MVYMIYMFDKYVAYLYFHRYLYGMHAFGLEETYLYDEAAKQARKVIALLMFNKKTKSGLHCIGSCK